MKKPIRVRIAPSPTGYLHIGTARAALFNWLFAKKEKGVFVLRIEDTDLERSSPAYEKDIIENLRWLGLNWDEGPADIRNHRYIGDYGPYRQSERLESYKKFIKKLLDEKLAYYCYCTEEELEAERQAMLSQGLPPKYSGKCRTAPRRKKGGVIRFKMPETIVSFKDLIRGEIKFDTALIGDIVVAKDLRTPLYNFAVVIDDYEMRISHVLRGEDHIANTPKQIMLQRALGFYEPHYAHLPLILNPDRSKISKRFADTAVNEYRKAGYLPEALVNFIALLGWHPKEEKEIMSLNEIIEEFDLGRVQKAGAVFNLEKLGWINSHYIKSLDDKVLLEKLKDFIKTKRGLSEKQILKIISLSKERVKKLSDFGELSNFFFELPSYPKELLIWKLTAQEKTRKNLEEILKILKDTNESDFNEFQLEKIISPFAEREGRGEVLWPLRVALSGKDASPGPYELLDVLEKTESVKRVEMAIKKLKK